MGPQPILLPLGPGRLGVDEVGTRQTGDKDLRLSGDAGNPRTWSGDHRQRHPGPIDFERCAGAMHPSHRWRPRPPLPGVKMLAELGVAVTFRMPGEIFQPQQPQRHAAAAQLLLDRLPIRQRTVDIAPVAGRVQSTVELLLA